MVMLGVQYLSLRTTALHRANLAYVSCSKEAFPQLSSATHSLLAGSVSRGTLSLPLTDATTIFLSFLFFPQQWRLSQLCQLRKKNLFPFSFSIFLWSVIKSGQFPVLWPSETVPVFLVYQDTREVETLQQFTRD